MPRRGFRTFGYDSDPFFHNIVEFAATGEDKVWVTYPEDRISQVFIDQLSRQVPIVAAFALLTGQGEAAWIGQKAQEVGHVDYAPEEIAAGLTHNGGHSVCIVGFIPNVEEPENSMFVFRNGYGTRHFSRHPMLRKPAPQAPRSGYGLISARHVDRYCWEYLYRI